MVLFRRFWCDSFRVLFLVMFGSFGVKHQPFRPILFWGDGWAAACRFLFLCQLEGFDYLMFTRVRGASTQSHMLHSIFGYGSKPRTPGDP